MKSYKVLGLMSGTSLDGVDLAICTFTEKSNKWNFILEKATTEPYPEQILTRLRNAHQLSGLELSVLDNVLGCFFGHLINAFVGKDKVDLIASHGHTIFHQPEIAFTKQIGSGAAIYATTGINTACDFRSIDVFLGGQGAPLVPLGDKHLFSKYDYRINLGGIANTSFEENGITKAYDICPVNQVFNHVAERIGQAYDNEGKYAQSGQLIPELLESFNNLDFYNQSAPKSLGREWVEKHFISKIDHYPLADFQHSFAHHVAQQLARSIQKSQASVLLTGGGAYNIFLIELLKKQQPSTKIIIPEASIISFKEAIIFGFLGLFGTLGKNTALASVTGASKDSISMGTFGDFSRSNIS